MKLKMENWMRKTTKTTKQTAHDGDRKCFSLNKSREIELFFFFFGNFVSN